MLKFRRRLFQYFIQALKHPDWFLIFVFGRIQIVRSFVTSISKQPLVEISKKITYFEKLNVDNVVEVLRKDAVYLGINLPKAIL